MTLSFLPRVFRNVFALLLLPGAASLYAELATNQAADLVLGQPNFTTSASAATPTGMNFPRSVAIDGATGKVFVADHSNHRVLRFADGKVLSNGAAAEAVFGQADFVSAGSGLAQNRMNSPTGVWMDSSGRLWVADRGNNRVLRFESAASKPSGAPADGVLGQLNFVSGASATTAIGLSGPAAVVTNAAGTLWVADRDNSRVLRFDGAALKVNGAVADAVLGQPDFVTATNGTSDVKIASANGLALSADGTLWVTDGNDRVLKFPGAATLGNGAAATGVLGQIDFVSSSAGLTATKFKTPIGVAIDASGTLAIGDLTNDRVLLFFNASSKTNGASADRVLGAANFTTIGGVVSATGMSGPQGVAMDGEGNLYVAQSTANRVTRYAQPVPVDGTPTLTISGGSKRTTTRTQVTLKGSATSPLGVLRVQFRVGGKGGFKATKGSPANWRAKITLKPGNNRITVIAVAGDGTVRTRVIRIIRKLP